MSNLYTMFNDITEYDGLCIYLIFISVLLLCVFNDISFICVHFMEIWDRFGMASIHYNAHVFFQIKLDNEKCQAEVNVLIQKTVIIIHIVCTRWKRHRTHFEFFSMFRLVIFWNHNNCCKFKNFKTCNGLYKCSFEAD